MLSFSTDKDICLKCKQAKQNCLCQEQIIEHNSEIIKLQRLKQGKGGKTVISITGFNLKTAKDMLPVIKKSLGVGGTLKHNIIEIQGDNIEKISYILDKHGFKSKKSGG